jgi:feruloyl-CoA synthase
MKETLRSQLRFATQEIDLMQDASGVFRIKSSQALNPHAVCISDWLKKHAADSPSRIFLAERTGDGADWRQLTYGDALPRVLRIAQGLLNQGLSENHPLLILSENSIDHALIALAAMHAGIPVVPVSTAYSLLDTSFSKLRHIHKLVKPGMVFAADPIRYHSALNAIGMQSVVLEDLQADENDYEVERAHAAVGPNNVAKILFTSGSTAYPKGVINTQRMLTANQQQSRQIWLFLTDRPPVVVDWLPWNHTFGGNYNFNMVLSSGGTMYIDGGRPMPKLIETTIRNLKEIAPTMYFNVPQGFDLLLPHLEQDEALRKNFFSRCEFVFYAAASLPQNLWDRLVRLAINERDGDMALVSAWGSTETAPLCTAVHYSIDRAGIVGLPVPGLEIKLVPNGGKLEARVRGPNVTPGYLGSVEETTAAFDEDGYYRMGDAMRFDDPSKPEAGLVFDGRVAEDFKLSTGTWVSAGSLRVQLIDMAAGLIQDAVITGHGENEVGALIFLNPILTAKLNPTEVRRAVASALALQQAHGGTGSSTRITRALILAQPPRADIGEITDKGYINQRFVLQNRQVEVRQLYAASPDPEVIHPI